MLKIKGTPKPRTAAIPSNVTTLSVSWLNNQFKAIAVHRGVVEGTWERPGEIEGTGNFEALVREAVQKTGYRGTTVTLLLAHPRLAQQLVDVPPVKGSALDKVVQRLAQQQKMFDGEAAFAYQPALSNKGSQRLVLHLFPKPLLDQLVQGCQRNDLHLTSVIPSTAVLQSQLAELPIEKEDSALLAADTGGATMVVIGRNDGQLLLARTLAGSWVEGAQRLAVDLNRTILFVNQQYGAAVDKGVWLFGPGVNDHVPAMQSQMQLPVKASPVEFTSLYWAMETVKLPSTLAPNFISRVLQQAPQRRRLAQVAVAVAGVVVIASLLAASYLNFLVRQADQVKEKLTVKAAQLQEKHKELQKIQEELMRKQETVKLVIDNRPPPVPGWFLGYLSEAVPSDLVVTNLHIKREDDRWKVQIAGMLQLRDQPMPPATLSNAVALLTAKLVNGPFHLKLEEEVEKEKEAAKALSTPVKPGTSTNTFAGWVARLTTSASAKSTTLADNQFVIEGVMR